MIKRVHKNIGLYHFFKIILRLYTNILVQSIIITFIDFYLFLTPGTGRCLKALTACLFGYTRILKVNDIIKKVKVKKYPSQNLLYFKGYLIDTEIES